MKLLASRIPRVIAACILLGVAAVSFGGCATTPPQNAEAWPEPIEPVVVLQPGDSIRFQFPYWTELDDQQVIRPDGKVSLQLVGEVTAQGLTPEALRNELLSLYASKIRAPEINLVVTGLDSHRIYVGGEVARPGVLPLPGRLTVLEAIMTAGGFNKFSARLAKVVLIRQRDGQRYVQYLDMRKALSEPQEDKCYLEPFDIIFVPRSRIDQVDQWVEKYINQIIPRNVHMNFNYEIDKQGFDSESTSFQVQPIVTP